MINSIERPKIPRDYAFVLRSSQLNELLENNKFTIYTDLIYWLPGETGSVLEAHYWLPNANISYDRLRVRAGSLLKKDVYAARKSMTYIVFPKFIDWLDGILNLPDNSTKFNKTPYFNAVYQNDKMEITTAFF